MKNCEKIINTDNLDFNISYIKSKLQKGVRLCAVVKADAYGHGVLPIVKHLETKVDCFAVSNNLEAVHILSKFPKAKVIVIGPFNAFGLERALVKGAEISVASVNEIQVLSALALRLNINIQLSLKLNTGMNRLGLNDKQEILTALGQIKSNPHLKLAGVFSHFGTSEKPYCKRTQTQIKNFDSYLLLLPNDITRHISNSGGICSEALQYDMVRAGISMYGYGDPNLKPVMSVVSRVVALHTLKRGEYLGYGNKHKLKKDTTIAVLSIGYGQGLPRQYAKRGYVLIHGQKAKILGLICMDMCFADVSSIANVKIDTPVSIIGTDNNISITAEDIAKACTTISYEILCGFSTIPSKLSKRLSSDALRDEVD